MMRNSFQVAIDGPVAAGKSTVARELAVDTDFVYVDTGAMYRAVTLAAGERGISLDDEDSLVELVEQLDIDVRSPRGEEKDGRLSTVVVNGKDVSWEIRGEGVSAVVAKVASYPRVREVLVPKQRAIASDRDVVMEGRDITYVVLPEADLKIYLTASEDVRVKRYHEKLGEYEEDLTEERAREMLMERDELDMTREASPLRIEPDAWVLDTSKMTIAEVVGTIAGRIREIRDKKK